MLGDIITAAFAYPLLVKGSKAPKNVIQYLPPGRHEITAKVNGETATREVVVEAGVERLFQDGLEAHQAENVEPFIDYLHDGGRASGHPKRFAWDEERGLTLEVDWTPNGSTTIASKELQFFSPEFLLSPEGKPLGLHPINKAIGGLVSDPAFVNIESVAAKRAASKPTETPTTKPQMDLTKFVELGVITAEQAKDPEKAAALIAEHVAASRSKDKDSATQAALVKANKEAADAKAEVQAMKEEAADKFVADAVTAGKIKAKDEDDKAFWKATFLNDSAVATAQMERRTGSDLTTPVTKVAAAREDGHTGDEKETQNLDARCKALVKAGKAKTYTEAFRLIGSDKDYTEYCAEAGIGLEGARIQAAANQAMLAAHRQSN